MTLSSGQLSALQQRLMRKQPATDDQFATEQKSNCLQWGDRLTTWPVRQIETAMALSNFQRASLYELTAVIYRSAGDLTQACPAGNPLTPVGRLELKEHQLRALQQDTYRVWLRYELFRGRLTPKGNEPRQAPLRPTPASRWHVC